MKRYDHPLGCILLLQVMTMAPVSGSPTSPPGAPARSGRGVELLHACQKWRLRMMAKTNPHPCILSACAGGRAQKNQRTTVASASRGSQRVCAPAGLGARTPTAEVIDQKADSRVTSVCNLLTPNTGSNSEEEPAGWSGGGGGSGH